MPKGEDANEVASQGERPANVLLGDDDVTEEHASETKGVGSKPHVLYCGRDAEYFERVAYEGLLKVAMFALEPGSSAAEAAVVLKEQPRDGPQNLG